VNMIHDADFRTNHLQACYDGAMLISELLRSRKNVWPV
jgi:hypothetical protein